MFVLMWDNILLYGMNFFLILFLIYVESNPFFVLGILFILSEWMIFTLLYLDLIFLSLILGIMYIGGMMLFFSFGILLYESVVKSLSYNLFLVMGFSILMLNLLKVKSVLMIYKVNLEFGGMFANGIFYFFFLASLLLSVLVFSIMISSETNH
uniref:NADH dehydrogenase subunit 6 n=1 Tax=Aplidium conicum TaxID=286149 RepID=D1GKZ0_APLCO|nr:NADH dehydrogenase subunit 6 [Aplidium conicum]CAX68844.1 NADH dehydrogenase subunit 6 [Aplidium conicum]